MFDAQLIGAYPDGIGYGNISIRKAPDSFFITGSGTGGMKELEKKHISLVTGWSHEDNRVTCSGAVNASAESLTHAAIYEAIPDAGAVIHIHHKGMWDQFTGQLPVTSPEALYGTPEMAKEVKRVALAMDPGKDPVIVMGGHEEGLIAWGTSLQEAGETLWKFYLEFRNTAPGPFGG